MKFDKPRSALRALALLIIAILLTTCGDDSSSSKDDRGIFGEWADMLTQTDERFVQSSEEIFASVEAMRPYMAATLGASQHVDGGGLEPLSCLREGVGGKIYVFDGEAYSGTTSSSVLEYTARFHLYELSGAGEPIIESELGFIDFTCVDLGPHVTETQVFADSALVASAIYSATTRNFVATFRNGHAMTMTLMGEPDSPDYFAVTYRIADTLEVHHLGSPDAQGEQSVQIGIYNPANKPYGSCWYYLEADSLNQIQTGFVKQHRSSFPGYAACIESGTLSDPAFSRSSESCATQTLELWDVNNAQLESMADMYSALNNVWNRTTGLLRICRSLVPPIT